MRVGELREMGKDDLLERLNHLQKELLDLKIQAVQGRMSSPSKIKVIRKDIARIKTILRERELGINTGA
ncbi:50S ribosomal protein L29 [Candidatus Aerophobetes bacterium]|nr:50S ribosomal protein L29 [Candidatus Aerophobetes bacterium]